MNIKSLEKMESLVDYNRSLSWDGWDVVELIKYPNAMYKKNGCFKEGKWYLKNVFPVKENGWSIPKKYIR